MTDHPSLAAKMRYRIDRLFSRGTPALIAALALLSAGVIVIVGGLVWALQLWPAGAASFSLREALWVSLMRTLDPGTMGGDEGWGFRLAMLLVTIGGIFVISTLIGVLTTGIEDRLATLRRGRTRVVEHGHTVILGWSEHVFTIVSELVIANENQQHPSIVLLSPRDKVEMEEEIDSRVGPTGSTRIVCRTGDAMEVADLSIVAVDAARAIIVLPPESGDRDAEAIKVVLALRNRPDRRRSPLHIVAPLEDPLNEEIARIAGGDEVEWVPTHAISARIIAQTCRQPGLSVVYTELMDFSGDEIYMTEEPELYGRPFADSLLAFETNTVIGMVRQGGQPQLNPPMDEVIEPGDKLFVIAEDDDMIFFTGHPTAVIEEAIRPPVSTVPPPQRTLILGWNRRGAELLRKLDHNASSGSEAVVVTGLAEEVGQAATEPLRNLSVSVRAGDTTSRRILDGLRPHEYDHIVVLTSDDGRGAQEADAATLMTLLHLRDAAEISGVSRPIVSEMLDMRNRRLAEVTRADDFIVSDHLSSLIMAQVSENKQINAILTDMFDYEGSEISIKPAGDYVLPGMEITFATVVEAARRRGQCALGYRIGRLGHDADQSWGVVVNPPKGSRLIFAEGDRVIVAAG